MWPKVSGQMSLRPFGLGLRFKVWGNIKATVIWWYYMTTVCFCVCGNSLGKAPCVQLVPYTGFIFRVRWGGAWLVRTEFTRLNTFDMKWNASREKNLIAHRHSLTSPKLWTLDGSKSLQPSSRSKWKSRSVLFMSIYFVDLASARCSMCVFFMSSSCL